MSGEASKPIDKATLWGGNRSPFSLSYGKLMMWFFLVSDALTFGGLLAAYGYHRGLYQKEWPIAEEVFNSFPFMGSTNAPLFYVAFMTFILIVSSVTMVLAVEAGHRNDKKGVIKWMLATLIGGFAFLGSQAWEWSHFIHGKGGYIVTTEGTQGYLNKGFHHSDDAHGHHDAFDGITITFNQGLENEKVVEGDAAKHAFESASRYVVGANMEENEYGPAQFGQFFFFITGFHGFHVLSGVMINLIVFLMVLAGTFDKRGHFEMVEKAGLYWHFVDLVWVFVFTFFYLI